MWVVLIRNMLTDHTHGWAFRAVHIGLAVVSIAFAVATWVIARRGRKLERARRHLDRDRGSGAERELEAAQP